MDTDIQRFLDHRRTAGALPGCVSRLNQNDDPTSVFSFVRGVLDQLTPGRIRNALGQTMILKHILDPQILKGHQAEGVCQCAAHLMCEIPSTVGDALMKMLDRPAAPGSFGCALHRPGEFPLCFGKLPFISAEETRVLDPVARREFGKAFQTHIYPDCQVVGRQWFRFYFASEAGVPIANGIPLNGEGFDFAFYRTMKDHFHRSDLGKAHTMLQQSKSELFESETIIPTITPKARITGFFSCLHSAKEGLESQVNARLNILKDLRKHICDLYHCLLPGSHISTQPPFQSSEPPGYLVVTYRHTNRPLASHQDA